MNKRSICKKLCLAGPLVLIAGCGGSSGVSNGYPAAPKGVGNPIGPGINGGTSMMVLGSGLTWRYAVSGTITKDYLDNNNNKQTVSGAVTKGTLVRVITSSSVNGTPALLQTDTFTYTLQGSAPTVEVSQKYISQGGDNSIAEIGTYKYGIGFAAADSAPLVPGTFGGTTNASGEADMVSYTVAGLGTGTVQSSYTVLGQESVASTTNVPYTAWKLQTTTVQSWNVDGLLDVEASIPLPPGFVLSSSENDTSVDEWVPALGAPCTSQLTVSQTNQVVISYTLGQDANKNTTITYVSQTLNKSETLNLSLIALS